jgi:site-specific recombinase XerD
MSVIAPMVRPGFLTSDKGWVSDSRGRFSGRVRSMPDTSLRTTAVPARELSVARLTESARTYARASKAKNTIRAYRADWADFSLWCAGQAAAPLPAAPETIAMYLAALADAGARVSTVQRRLSAISQAHQAAGHVPSPTSEWLVRATMSGIRRTHGTAPRQKAPLVTRDLRRLLEATPVDTLAGLRDRALLLMGFAGGFRRSELVALDVDDVDESKDGLRVVIRRSKADQEGASREVGLPRGQHPETCPVRALRIWRAEAGIDEGALFRPVSRHDTVAPRRLTDRGVARVVQRAARRAGLDPALYAGHSLRAGLATAAAGGGAPERAIMRQTGHRSLEMVRRYIRAGTLWQENAAAYVGL